VQVALTACNIACPRDSDLQEKALGEPLLAPVINTLRRGDLLFWKGHVAIARGDGTIIHANAYHMAVAVEPIDGAVARIAASGSALTSIRRLKAA
jgi:cell wall-associated NlpC family hydrolase